MSKGGRFSNKKKKKSGMIKVLIAASSVMVLMVAVLMSGMVYRTSMARLAERREELMAPSRPFTAPTGDWEGIDYGDDEPAGPGMTIPDYTESGKNIINILIIGQNYRETPGQVEESRLADTIILATVNKDTKTLTLTSFLRDTWVDLPNYGEMFCVWNRINTAYALGYEVANTGGAMEMMNMTMELNFGIQVDHDVEISFESFVKIIDMLGGYEVELTDAYVKYLIKDGATIPDKPGVHHLDGRETLMYARMRSSGDTDNDIMRAQRQRNLIIDLLKKMMSMNILELRDMVYEVLPMITTNMTKEDINTYVWELLPLLPELSFETVSIPYEGTYRGVYKNLYGQQAAVLEIYEWPKVKAHMMEITEGIPAEQTTE